MTPERFVHYTLGVPNIDADHYKLLTITAEIVNLVKGNKHNEAEELLARMCVNLRNHLLEEENFLRAINFKYIDYHIADHKKMISILSKIDITKIKYDFEITSFASSIEELLINHIDHYDTNYAVEAKKHPELFNQYHELIS